jgi:HD-like signal output (HDOD) protein
MDTGAERLLRWIERARAIGSDELPVFPLVAGRLVELLERPEAELSEVAQLIAQDPVIAAQVLRVANSALYAAAVPVESLATAVLRLGLRETTSVALTAAYRSLYDLESRAEREAFPEVWSALWHDSLVCAYGARLVARELEAGAPERVFLAAMLRNLGSVLILKLLARGLVSGRLRRRPGRADLEVALRHLHPEVGADYLERARMPAYAVAAARHHHAEALPLSPETLDLHLVRVADGYCEQIGVAPFASGAMSPSGEESLALLGIGAERRAYLELQLRGLAEQLQGLLRAA